MTLRMTPWEAERIANVLGGVEMPDKSMISWAKACAERIKAEVKAEKRRRDTKRCCSTCKWLAGSKTLEPNCIKNEINVYPDATCCGMWQMKE